MPQLQSLVLTDRTPTTPVDHTFTPLGAPGGLSTVVETSGVPLGNKSVKIAMGQTATGRYKGVLKMIFPVVQTETIDGISNPKVVRTAYVNLDVTFEPTHTLQERNDVIGMLASALGTSKTLVNDAFVKLESVY